MAILMWKPYTGDALPPKWIKEKKRPGKTPGKVNVTSFLNGWCPAQNLICERAKRAVSEFGDKIEFNMINTFPRDVLLEWGISDGLYIDGKAVRNGPPPSYARIRKKVAKRVKKLKK